jgi:transglutaminase superfamily protein
MHERLVIIRSGQRQSVSIQGLRHGSDGNVQTLRYAAEMVRAAAADEWLRARAVSLVSQCDPHDAACEIAKVFEFVRDRVRYVDDPPGHERLADARSTLLMPAPAGDCLDKAVLLMSLLATIGYRSQFIVQEWEGDVDANGFDHVHPEVFTPDGSVMQADATERSGILDYEMPSKGRMRFEVWLGEAPAKRPATGDRRRNAGLDFTRSSVIGHPSHLSGVWDSLISQGAAFGAQYGQGAMQQSRAKSEAATQINSQWNAATAQALQLFQSISARMPNITAADYNAAVQTYQALEDFVSQYGSLSDYITTQWNDPSYKQAAQHDLALYQAALVQSATGDGGPTTVSAVSGQPSSVSSLLSSPWAIAGIVFIAVLALRK